MALLLVTWHARGAEGASLLVAVVLTWHMKRQQLAATVMWHVMGLWTRDEVDSGGQQGVQLTWGHPFPGLLVLMLMLALPMLSLSLNRSLLLSSCA